MNNIPPDFIATLHYKTKEEGGRSTPALSGYRPAIKFSFDRMYTGCIQTFINTEAVCPGDIEDAYINIVGVPYFAGRLNEGMEFTFSEGQTVIGTGVIKEIINVVLRKV